MQGELSSFYMMRFLFLGWKSVYGKLTINFTESLYT
jgi:hypothetical protein